MALSQQTTVRLLGGGDARGLSGDARRVLPRGAELDFFDACLKRHRSTVDLVVDPDRVWEVEESEALRPMGLHAHLASASPERLTSLVDVLIIISDHDWERAQQNHGARWLRHLTAVIRASFEDWCVKRQIQRRNPHRALGVRVLTDGSSDMHGLRLGLGPGEFVTGLLPNFYSGPATASRALLSVMINLPGQWEGYREVARLYDDQDLLTLGNHWLDNFSHPALQAPALYRLQYHPDDGLVHLTNPDTESSYTLTRYDGADGASVYGIVGADGQVVLWLILAVIEAAAVAEATRIARDRYQTIDGPLHEDAARVADPAASTVADTASEPRPDTLEKVAEPASLPSVAAPPASIAPEDGASSASSAVVRPDSGDASVPFRGTAEASGLEHGLFSIREAGVLLQRVHFRAIMLGYEVYISATGEVGSDLPNPSATVQVVGRRVRLYAHERGVRVAGEGVQVNAAAVLSASTQIEINGIVLDYHDRSDVSLDGWPYLGEIRRRGSNIHLTEGSVHRIGRDPSSAVRLPSDRHHGNIIWRPEVDAGAVIRSRNGDIPKERFTLDSIMVASFHAEIDLKAAPPQVRNLARNCFSFVHRVVDGESSWIPLSRVERATGSQVSLLEPGDELYIGNCILRVDGAGVPVEPLPDTEPPPMAFSLADELSGSLGARSLPPPPPRSGPPAAIEPSASGVHAELPLQSGGRQISSSTGISTTWMEAPSAQLPRVAVERAHESLQSTTEPANAPDAALPSPTSPDSVDETWSPIDAFADDPTDVPLPRFMQQNKS